MDNCGLYSLWTAESNFKNPLLLNKVLIIFHMCSGKLSLPLEKEGETSQRRAAMTPIPQLWVCASFMRLLHLESCYCCSSQSAHRQTAPKRVRRPSGVIPCRSKTPLQVVFSFHVDATLQHAAQMSVKNFRYPPVTAALQFSLSHQDKLCSLLTMFCKLALIPRDYLRILKCNLSKSRLNVCIYKLI